VGSAVIRTVSGATETGVVYPGIAQMPGGLAAARDALTDLVPGPGQVVTLVGRLHPVKGYREAIAIAPGLNRRVPGARILFVGGEDPAYPMHARELRELAGGFADVVAWAGHRTDAFDLIAASDVLLVTSGSDPTVDRGEGFGYTALEALAAGTPVVGYARGGLPEVVGGCGRLVDPGRRGDLEDALVEILNDRALSEQMASCGRARVETTFALDRFVAEMQRIYSAIGT
jgi:glycosyltransferase involved in cell wall biosynthesis